MSPGKALAIAAGALLALAGGGALYLQHRIGEATKQPLEIPDVAARPEVVSSLKRRIKQNVHIPPGATPDGAPAGAEPDTITLLGEELTLLLLKLLPAIEGLKLAVEIADGQADLQLSLPGKEAARLATGAPGALRGYLGQNVGWLNVRARAGVSVVAGRLAIAIREVREPSFLTPERLQPLLDGALAAIPAGPLKVPQDELTFQLAELELDGNLAIAKVFRLPVAHAAR